MYRATFADGSVLHVRHGREAMTDEIRPFAGAEEAASFGRFADWLTELYRVEMPNFIDADFDSALDLVRRWRAGAQPGPARRVRPPRPPGGLVLRRRAAAADLQLPGDVRRRRAVRGPGAVRRDHLHGLDRGRLRAGGRDARHGHRPGRGRGQGAGPTSATTRRSTRILRAGDGAVRGVELAGGERIDADVVVCNADLPVAYRTLLGGVEAPRRRPPRSLLTVVPAVGRRRAWRAAGLRGPPQHPLRRAVGRLVPGAHPRRRA